MSRLDLDLLWLLIHWIVLIAETISHRSGR